MVTADKLMTENIKIYMKFLSAMLTTCLLDRIALNNSWSKFYNFDNDKKPLIDGVCSAELDVVTAGLLMWSMGSPM